MTQQEIVDIMSAVGKLNPNEMEIQDQALYLIALSRFAETTKPLVIKYADKLPKNSNFLIKL